MARPKTPYAKAYALGAVEKHPERYRPLPAPHSWQLGQVGEPPAWLKPEQAQAWKDTADEVTWLDSSHRGILAIVAILRARLRTGDESVKAMNLLRLCLAALGATPATEHIARR